jgi:beta-phosphoglucomutase-like phosphatase (HAD superfamily)
VGELAERVPLAIASGGRGVEIAAVLRAHGILHRFAAVVSADDVGPSKPAPDGFLRAMEALRAGAPSLGGALDPIDCLAIEDTPPGIAAAKAAGMPCLAVAHTFPEAALSGADAIAARLGDLEADAIAGRSRCRFIPDGRARTAR